jgi:secretion/DNA translocation related TadE-like protein
MVLGFGLVVVIAIFGLGVGLVGGVAVSYATAATAADAAALAAAPVTFRPFGASGTPRQEAARFAEANGATLISCTCPTDRSWLPRTVTVTVSRSIDLPVLGSVSVRATSRADFDPLLLVVP